MTRLWHRLARRWARARSHAPIGGHAAAGIGGHAVAGLVLLAAAAVAMALANSPVAPAWEALLDRPIWGNLRSGARGELVNLFLELSVTLPSSVRAWVDQGLMAVFFFAIGLEIKREVLVGDLAHAPTRRLPILAAAAGMAGPALAFLAGGWLLAPGAHAILRGWAIPAATDIAFALGVLGLLGRRVPASLRLFLLTLAVVDDLGATVVIALAYAGPVTWGWLGAGVVVLTAMAGLNRAGCRTVAPFTLLAVCLWFCVLASGLHPTVAGVLAALTVPMAARGPHGRSLLLRMEHALAPWSAFAIVPLFALVNAGVTLGAGFAGFARPLTLAVIAGLLLGKQAGVLGAVWAAERLGLARRPRGTSWMQIWGASLLCGIGFTMSLLITTLAFQQAPALAAQARLGILGGSLASALLGFAVLWWAGGAERP